MKTYLKGIAVAAMAMASINAANATRIFFTNDSGNVRSLDTVTNTVTSIANLSSSFGISQVIGLAYDGATNTVYAFDRFPRNVYAINAGSGAASLALTANVTFQGGAFKNGILYGIDESSQTLEGYTLGGVDLGIGGTNIDHTHGLGIDVSSGQLYIGRNGNIFKLGDDGTLGGAGATIGGFAEDLDYFNGDFAFVQFDRSIYLASGGTLFTSANLESLSGIAVDQGSVLGGVPEPASWALMIAGFGMVGAAARRRQKVRVTFA